MIGDTALLEERMRDSIKAPEPGEFSKGGAVTTGDKDIDTMTLGDMTSAGWVYIWDTVTGERSITNRNMLPTQLGKKRSNGSFVFSTVAPGITPKRGKLKCMLHPENPNREHYEGLGFPICTKSNLTSPMQVGLHMRHRHKMEWATIEDERKEAEKQEDRAFQRNLMRGLETKHKKEKVKAG